MRTFSMAPTEIAASFWRNRELIGILVRREVAARYRDSLMGLLWSLIQPTLMLVIYVFFFGKVFQSRWPGMPADDTGAFALALFSGLIVYNLFADCVARAPALITANVAYVKKIVFPLETLPMVALGAALFQAFVSVLVWIAFHLCFAGAPSPTILWVPLLWVPYGLLLLGVMWLLAVAGAFFRDISQIIGLVTTLFLFISPVFFSVESMPERYRFIYALNPLTPVIENVRRVMWAGQSPDWRQFGASLAVGAAAAWAGFALFQRARKEFADGI